MIKKFAILKKGIGIESEKRIIYGLCCRPVKKEYDGEMGILYNPSKIMKLIP